MDREENESLQITHAAQERSKCGQGGQMPGAIHTPPWMIQLHPSSGPSQYFPLTSDLQLLTAQMYGSFSLLHPLEGGVRKLFRVLFAGKFCENLNGAKCCFVIELGSVTGALPELVSSTVLAPDTCSKFMISVHKSSTRSFYLL